MLKKFIILLSLIFSIVSCHREEKKTTASTDFTVENKSVVTPLFYAGSIQPLRPQVITAPTEGVVNDIYFHYGDTVQKGQLLFTLNSEKFQSDYKTALLAFIKAKNEFNTNQNQLKEGTFLHKNELISEDDFKSRQTNFYSAQLALLQAKDGLSHLLKQLHLKNINYDQLSISDIDKITKLFSSQVANEKIKIYAPSAGIILQAGKGDSSDKKVEKGQLVKEGDLLGLIGQANGFTVLINVSEYDINQLQLGQKVKVSGSAFNDFLLDGQVSGLDHQAQANQSGLPTFTVEVTVPNMSSQQAKVIHVGMTAKVEIDIASKEKILIPLNSVFEKSGEAYVHLVDQVTKAVKDVKIKTGQTSQDKVEVLANLKAGDSIVVPH